MIGALTDRMGRIIATPRGFYVFLGVYIGAVFLTRAVDLKLLDLADPPRNIDAGQCLLIWDDVDDPGVREGVIGLAARRFGVEAEALKPVRTISQPMLNAPDRIIRLGFILIPEGSGKCR